MIQNIMGVGAVEGKDENEGTGKNEKGINEKLKKENIASQLGKTSLKLI